MLLDTDTILSALPGSLDDTQRASARVIVDQFWRAGWPPSYALAALANAKAESDLYPNAVGDLAISTHGSVGLFQLLKDGSNGAAGHLSVVEAPRPLRAGTRDGVPAPGDVRADARANTRLILEEVARHNHRQPGPSSVPSLADAHASGDAGAVASSFAAHIERPANAIAKGVQRAGILRAWFPQWSGAARASSLEWASPPPKGEASTQLMRTGATVLVVVGVLVLVVLGAIALFGARASATTAVRRLA